MTIVEFLTARLDEDEKAARAAFSSQADPENGWGEEGRAVTPHVGVIHEDIQRAHVVRWHPGAVLTEIAAKRAIVHQHGNGDGAHECPDGFMDGAETEPHIGWEVVCMTQRHLASVYADHPDYNPEWRA